METDEDHLHVFVSAPPRFSPALLANLLKGSSSRYLREQFPHLNKVCGKDHLWTNRYYVGTAGSVSAETLKRYREECQGKETCEGALSSRPLERGGTSRSLR
jgi:putative transposase